MPKQPRDVALPPPEHGDTTALGNRTESSTMEQHHVQAWHHPALEGSVQVGWGLERPGLVEGMVSKAPFQPKPFWIPWNSWSSALFSPSCDTKERPSPGGHNLREQSRFSAFLWHQRKEREGGMVVGTRRAVGMGKPPTLALDLQKGQAPAAAPMSRYKALCQDTAAPPPSRGFPSPPGRLRS